jgi:hypothetical protein
VTWTSGLRYPDGRPCAAPLHSPECHISHDGYCLDAEREGPERAGELNAERNRARDAKVAEPAE